MEESRARESRVREIRKGERKRDRDKTKGVNKVKMLGRISNIHEEVRKGNDRRGSYGNVEKMLMKIKRKKRVGGRDRQGERRRR